MGGWRRPGGDETYPVETMMKVAFLKSFPLKKENEKGDEKMGFVTEQKGTRRRASDWRREQGHPTPDLGH